MLGAELISVLLRSNKAAFGGRSRLAPHRSTNCHFRFLCYDPSIIRRWGSSENRPQG